MRNKILIGDNRETLRTLPDQFVHCCVTSPPYWGLRDYGVDNQIGLEKTPEEFVAELVNVFREVRRVLRDDATLWVNLGDSYAANRGGTSMPAETLAGGISGRGDKVAKRGRESGYTPHRDPASHGLKHKDLVGIPWRVAFALQADGWYLRQEIIWHKPAPMPESVRDRCTKAHEHIFLLAKQPRYYYDAEAVKEEAETGHNGSRFDCGKTLDAQIKPFSGGDRIDNGTRNRRSVWTVNTQGFSGAHFATYPPALIEPCILAGTSAKGACPACGAPWVRIVERDSVSGTTNARTAQRGARTFEVGTTIDSRTRPPRDAACESHTIGWQPSCNCNAGDPIPCIVLDPFGGAGTTAIVAEGHGRDWILCELNESYANDIAWPRIRQGWSPVTGKAKTPVADGQKSLF